MEERAVLLCGRSASCGCGWRNVQCSVAGARRVDGDGGTCIAVWQERVWMGLEERTVCGGGRWSHSSGVVGIFGSLSFTFVAETSGRSCFFPIKN